LESRPLHASLPLEVITLGRPVSRDRDSTTETSHDTMYQQ
jgi:hypothetical protein